MALPTNGLTLRLECLGRSNFTLDVNDKVESWIDQATYGNFVQTTEAKRPEYFDDINGSGPILRFGNGGASHLLSNANTLNNLMSDLSDASKNNECWIVAQPIGFGTSYQSASILGGVSSNAGLHTWFGGTTPGCNMGFSLGLGSTWNTTSLLPTYKNKMTCMHGMARYSNSLKYKNYVRNVISRGQVFNPGAELTITANPDLSLYTATVGGYFGAETYKLQAYVKAIIFYNRTLTQTERNQVDAYLKTTYSLKIPSLFIDQNNGNDSNDGTTMSTAKKNHATAISVLSKAGEYNIISRRNQIETVTANFTPTSIGVPAGFANKMGWPRSSITGLSGDFTNGSCLITNITGVSLEWRKHEGRRITAPDGRTYVIAQVVSTSSCNLQNYYRGTTATGSWIIREDYDYATTNAMTAFDGADQKATWDADTHDVPMITTAGAFYAWYASPMWDIKNFCFKDGNGSFGNVYTASTPDKWYGCLFVQTLAKINFSFSEVHYLQDCVLRYENATNSVVNLQNYGVGELTMLRCSVYSIIKALSLIGISTSFFFTKASRIVDSGIGLIGAIPDRVVYNTTSDYLIELLIAFIDTNYRYDVVPFLIPSTIRGHSRDRLLHVNYNGVDGWNYIYQPRLGIIQTNFGDANITLPTNRTWVLEVLPNLGLVADMGTRIEGVETTTLNPLLEWKVSLKNAARLLKVYVSAEEGLCETDCWLETSYYKNGQLVVAQSTGCIIERSGIADWSQYLSIAVDSDSDEPVQVRLFTSHTTVYDKKFYVDPLIKEISLQAVFAGTDAFVQGKVPVVTDVSTYFTIDKNVVSVSAGTVITVTLRNINSSLMTGLTLKGVACTDRTVTGASTLTFVAPDLTAGIGDVVGSFTGYADFSITNGITAQEAAGAPEAFTITVNPENYDSARIEITLSSNAIYYVVYRDGTPVSGNIKSHYFIDPCGAGAFSYKVIAYGETSSTDSNTISFTRDSTGFVDFSSMLTFFKKMMLNTQKKVYDGEVLHLLTYDDDNLNIINDQVLLDGNGNNILPENWIGLGLPEQRLKSIVYSIGALSTEDMSEMLTFLTKNELFMKNIEEYPVSSGLKQSVLYDADGKVIVANRLKDGNGNDLGSLTGIKAPLRRGKSTK
jgi:hypothetical protein